MRFIEEVVYPSISIVTVIFFIVEGEGYGLQGQVVVFLPGCGRRGDENLRKRFMIKVFLYLKR